MSQLYRPSQLNNLSRTCKQLRAVTQPRLYREFSIILPRSWSSVRFLETLLESGAEGLQFTRSITVSMQNDEHGAPSESYDHGEDEWQDHGGSIRQEHHQVRALNTLLQLLIGKVPNGCLQVFR